MAVIKLGCVHNTEMDFRTFEDLGPGNLSHMPSWTSLHRKGKLFGAARHSGWEIVVFSPSFNYCWFERNFRIRDYEHLEPGRIILLALVELLG